MKQQNIGEQFVLEMKGHTLIGTLYWSDKRKFRFMLEFSDPFKYHQRIYFNDARQLKQMEIIKYECVRINEGYVRRRVTPSLGGG